MATKPSWVYRQSAVVPYLWHGQELQVVLITSARSQLWGIPKGIIEPDLGPAQSAAKEAEEEAGAIGTPSDTLMCDYTYDKWGGICHVQVFPMLVTELLETWDEADFRERTVVSVTAALDMVKPELVRVLQQFSQFASDLRHSTRRT